MGEHEGVVFVICLTSQDMRLANHIVYELGKANSDEVASFAGEVGGEGAKIVCYLWQPEQLPLWKILEYALLETRRYKVSIQGTCLYGNLTEALLINELKYFLKCSKIEKTYQES